MKKILMNKKLLQKLGLVMVLWILGVFACLFLRKTPILHDAGDYWGRGAAIFQKGNISILNLANGFRGYVYPLYLGICNLFGEFKGFVIINSFVNSIFFVYVVPTLHGNKLEEKRDIISTFAVFVLFNVFHYGLSIYPLTDMFAIILCSTSVFALLKIRENSSTAKGIVLSMLFGFLVYAAYNVRTIYLFAGIILVIFFLVYLFTNRLSLVKKVLYIVASITGFGISAYPQFLLNYTQLKSTSISVPTEGLMLNQVLWGLQYQRYDTLAILTEKHPEHPMYFMDPVGNALLSECGIEAFNSWKEFILFILEHPFDVLGIYVRHFVNILFPCWPETYITNLDNFKVGYGILFYTCIFVFLVALLNKFIKNGQVFANYSPLLVAMLFIMAGAVEIRFAAALYLLIIGVLFYNVKWNELKNYFMKSKAKMITLYIVGGLLLLALWTNMLATESMQYIFMS